MNVSEKCSTNNYVDFAIMVVRDMYDMHIGNTIIYITMYLKFLFILAKITKFDIHIW